MKPRTPAAVHAAGDDHCGRVARFHLLIGRPLGCVVGEGRVETVLLVPLLSPRNVALPIELLPRKYRMPSLVAAQALELLIDDLPLEPALAHLHPGHTAAILPGALRL